MIRSRVAKLVAAVLLLAAIASPSVAAPLPTVSNVVVTPAPTLANHKAVYTITFRTSSTGALVASDSITLKFPIGTTPGNFCGDVASFANNVTVAVSGGGGGNYGPTTTSVSSFLFCLEMKVTVPAAIGNNKNVTVVVGSVTPVVGNPGKGTYAMKVHTTKDFGDANSKKYSIVAQHAPIAIAQSVSTNEDTLLPITLTGSDTDGDTLTFSIVTVPAHGSLSPITQLPPTSAQVSYTPTGDYFGSDSFQFRVSDGIVNSAAQTVSITVTNVNDAPVATDDDATVAHDSGANAINVLANDTDPDGDILTITATTNGSDGTTAITGGGTGLTYTPNAGFEGNDSFTYTIEDGAAPTPGSDTATVHVEVTPTGGGGTPASHTIDLCAKVNPTWDIGPTDVAIWGFALKPDGVLCSDSSVVAQLPGPMLGVDTPTITAGDTVTVVLHNEVPSQDVALEFLGQNLFPDTVGAGTGGMKSYTFTASDPGTYLYESGVNRQALMGLYGALIVRPAATVPPRAYNSAATAYDAEAVLVLSEVDLLFNADPTGFNLLHYDPKYWLINGKAYPDTDTIDVAAGNRVLLRYVNAGSLHHTMAILGTHQQVIGRDAYQVRYPYDVVAETIAAGSTEDMIATIPAAGTYWLYNRQLHLDNAGDFPGGMLTYVTAT